MKGHLYIVATPIGNLSELSPRAADTLRAVRLIACEDTRVTSVLLSRFEIHTPLLACHKFNEEEAAAKLVARLRQGEDIALVCDAGTPGVSDPGYKLVAAAAAEDIPVTAVAGPCALAAGLSLSGFSLLSFGFYGFLPKENAKLETLLDRIGRDSPPVAAVYVSPRRIEDALLRVHARWPTARCCLCNDLTKRYERVYRGLPCDILAALRENPHADKGEYTLIWEKPAYEPGERQISAEALLVDELVARGGTLRDAVARLAAGGLPKNALYQAGERLKTLLERPV